MIDADIAYYEYYDCEMVDHVSFASESGHEQECFYYYYIPKDGEIDETTPVVAYVTHGGGTAEDERALALHKAASQDTRAIFVIPYTDRPDAVCASIEDARSRLNGKGNFAAISGHGTSSGGRAIMQAAVESVNPDADYGFRFANIFAYDPAEQTDTTNIREQSDALRRLAEQGTVFFIQTDTDSEGHGGSGAICNRYARAYSEAGGTAIVAEIESASHENKFIMPLTHNSINWAIGRGQLIEDEVYRNNWYYYLDNIKHPSSLEEAGHILHPGGQ